MKLPNGERAIVEISKVRDYCLSPTHPRVRHKARVFASSLRVVQADAEWLRVKLLQAALHGDAREAEADDYGRRYFVDFECVKEGNSARVRSGWIVRRGEDFPRLNTCFVISK